MEWKEFCEYVKMLRRIERQMRGPSFKPVEDMFSIKIEFLSKKYTMIEFDVDFIDLRTGIITGTNINMRELLREEKPNGMEIRTDPIIRY